MSPVETNPHDLVARAAKRSDWASRALLAASEDLRASHVPEFRDVAEYLAARREQARAVTRALNGSG